MTLVGESVEKVCTGVGVCSTPDGLSSIHRPSRAAQIWRRQPVPSFRSWIDTLEPARLTRARMTLRPEAVREAALKVCGTCGTPDGAERSRLVDDIAAQADMFAGVTDAAYLRLRLDVVTANASRKLHTDAIPARLACTYLGTVTLYRFGTKEADPDRVFTVPRGAPILLRGTAWPERPASGLLHRSPPIEATGETRLVLVLDPIDDPDEAA